MSGELVFAAVAVILVVSIVELKSSLLDAVAVIVMQTGCTKT